MKRFKGCRGQSIAEYGFVLALVAVMAIGTGTGMARRAHKRFETQRETLRKSEFFSADHLLGSSTNQSPSSSSASH
jgi:Flp pilus assembly pilin Flp